MIKLGNNVTRKMLPFRLTNANNLPLCHRLKPNGNNLIVQKCELKAIEVTARLKKCGYEPEYQNYTIGKDGYSFHPF